MSHKPRPPALKPGNKTAVQAWWQRRADGSPTTILCLSMRKLLAWTSLLKWLMCLAATLPKTFLDELPRCVLRHSSGLGITAVCHLVKGMCDGHPTSLLNLVLPLPIWKKTLCSDATTPLDHLSPGSGTWFCSFCENFNVQMVTPYGLEDPCGRLMRGG